MKKSYGSSKSSRANCTMCPPVKALSFIPAPRKDQTPPTDSKLISQRKQQAGTS